MDDLRQSWSTQQLVDFLAVVSAEAERIPVLQTAIERAAEALEADVGAIVERGVTVAATGFGPGELPAAQLRALARERRGTLALPWGGTARCLVVPIGSDDDARLILGRDADDGFNPEEASLLRGMARVLALTRRSLGLLDEQRLLLDALNERGQLLERLSRIQNSIVRRGDLQEVLDAIVEGAQELLGDEAVALRLVDPADPRTMAVVAATGMAPQAIAKLSSTPVGETIGGRAMAENRLLTSAAGDAGPGTFIVDGVCAALAAPVHENGRAIGSLTVASSSAQRVYSDAEKDTLTAFAEHASLALTDARNVQKAMHEALYDSLTGLANRRAFLDAVRRAGTMDRRADRRSAVLLIDVDNFKSINDALGHHAGDLVLCAVADRLRECIRDSDTPARLGGDEFAVLLEDCGEDGAEQAAARVVEAFDAPFTVDGRGVNAGVSVGVSLDSGTPEDLLRQADLAMYAAKAAGKDRYAAFVPAMQQAADRRRALEQDLRHALRDGGLFLQYQPIVRLADESVVGAEALLRWRHPERGLITPSEFIPLAEEAGLIVPLGRWVLGEATRQGAAWRERWPWLAMGVNVSGVQVGHPDFIAHVTEALADSGLRHRNLTLELTESVLMHDVEATIARLWEAKELGVQIAADDFGTGYSSLQYLDRFPLDILKLPRAFVEGLDAGGGTIARAVVELGHNLGLRVVGEGIERHEQLAALRQIGCALGQGFHFARPLDAPAFEALLGASARPAASAGQAQR
jgi:diguanylate cyclase (GGDEF)-like protein